MEQFQTARAFINAGMSSKDLKGSYSILKLIHQLKTSHEKKINENTRMIYSLAQTVAENKNMLTFHMLTKMEIFIPNDNCTFYALEFAFWALFLSFPLRISAQPPCTGRDDFLNVLDFPQGYIQFQDL